MSTLPDQMPSRPRRRPRAVTLGGMQAVVGSAMGIVLLVSAAQQLNGSEMTDTLAEMVENEQVAALGLTVETARTLLRYAIMVMAVLSAASLVLGVYVLRRHRPARIALTVIGCVVGAVGLLAGPIGWAATLYIGASIFMIWSRPAREWFADGVSSGGRDGRGSGVGGPGSPGGPPHDSQVGPPTGPRRDVNGILPPAPPPSGSQAGDSPPPPPPPRPLS